MLHYGVGGGKVLTQCAVGFDTDLARKRGAAAGAGQVRGRCGEGRAGVGSRWGWKARSA